MTDVLSLTIPLKSCQSPKFICISFFNSSRLHWVSTRPFMLACNARETFSTDCFFFFFNFKTSCTTHSSIWQRTEVDKKEDTPSWWWRCTDAAWWSRCRPSASDAHTRPLCSWSWAGRQERPAQIHASKNRKEYKWKKHTLCSGGCVRFGLPQQTPSVREHSSLPNKQPLLSGRTCRPVTVRQAEEDVQLQSHTVTLSIGHTVRGYV